MNTVKPTASNISKSLVATALLAFSAAGFAASLISSIDDFSDAQNNSLGMPRQFMNDSLAGGKTTTQQSVSEGVLHVKGKIVPPRGQPGWASSVLPLSMPGQAQNASAYEGIRLWVKINQGNLSLSANSTEVTNFDYHAAPVVVAADGQFHELKIPFTSMKRAWSEQTRLNTATLNSISIVAYSLQPAIFDFEVDEVSFY